MKLSKKMLIAGAGVVAAVGIGSAAFAFFSTSGSGEGSGTVKTTLANLTLTPSFATDAALYPGSDVPITVKAENGNPVDIKLGAIGVTISSITSGATSLSKDDCKISVVGTSPLETTVAKKVGTVLGSADISGFSLKMVDNPSFDQTPCLTATIVLSAATI